MINLKRLILGYIFGCALIFCMQWSYYSFMPVSHFYKYEKKVEYSRTVDIGIEFISFAFGRSGTHARWSDVLYCQLPNESNVTKYSTHQFDELLLKTKYPTKEGQRWVYTGNIPSLGSRCFLEYAPILTFKYGITRYVPKDRTETFLIN